MCDLKFNKVEISVKYKRHKNIKNKGVAKCIKTNEVKMK